MQLVGIHKILAQDKKISSKTIVQNYFQKLLSKTIFKNYILSKPIVKNYSQQSKDIIKIYHQNKSPQKNLEAHQKSNH